MPRRMAVNCFASPPPAGTRYMSSTQKPVTLLNATVLPSGANFGFQSPHKSGGGEVSFRFSPLCRSYKKMANGLFVPGVESENARSLPSADQSIDELKSAFVRSTTLCSWPLLLSIQ